MNTNKIATGSTSKRLLAALAVLAVAFVVLAAVPAVANTSDATDTETATNPVQDLITKATEGKVTLDQDYVITSSIVISSSIEIDGDGHTITAKLAEKYDHAIDISGSSLTVKIGNLTLKDESTAVRNTYGIVSAGQTGLNLTVDSVTIQGFGLKGLYINDQSSGSLTALTVQDSKFVDTANYPEVTDDPNKARFTYMGGDHALQIDQRGNTSTTATVVIKDNTFIGNNGNLAEISITDSKTEATTAFSSVTVSGNTFSDSHANLANIAFGSTPYGSSDDRIGLLDLPATVTANGETKIVFRGQERLADDASEESMENAAKGYEAAPLYVTLADQAVLTDTVTTSGSKGVTITLTSGSADITGTVRSGETIAVGESAKLTYDGASASVKAAASVATDIASATGDVAYVLSDSTVSYDISAIQTALNANSKVDSVTIISASQATVTGDPVLKSGKSVVLQNVSYSGTVKSSSTGAGVVFTSVVGSFTLAYGSVAITDAQIASGTITISEDSDLTDAEISGAVTISATSGLSAEPKLSLGDVSIIGTGSLTIGQGIALSQVSGTTVVLDASPINATASTPSFTNSTDDAVAVSVLYTAYSGSGTTSGTTSAIVAGAIGSLGIAEDASVTLGASSATTTVSGDIVVPKGATLTLGGSVTVNGTLTVESGATLALGNNTLTIASGATMTVADDATFTGASATTLVFASGAEPYTGPAIVDNGSLALGIAYPDGSVLSYLGYDYAVFSRVISKASDGTETTIRYMVNGVTIEYTGSQITNRDIQRIGPQAEPLVEDLTVGVSTFGIDSDFTETVQEPKNYDEAIEAVISWAYKDSRTGTMQVWVDITVTKIDISDIKVTSSDLVYTGSDLSGDAVFTFGSKNAVEFDEPSSAYTVKLYSAQQSATSSDAALDEIVAVGTYYAVITIDDEKSTHFTGTSYSATVKIVQTDVVVTLDGTETSWNSERYDDTVDAAFSLKSTGAAEPETDFAAAQITINWSNAKNADGTLNLTSAAATSTTTAVVADTTAAATYSTLADFQDALDAEIAKMVIDSGATFYLQIVVADGSNVKGGTFDFELTVDKFIPLDDYVDLSVTDPDEGVTLELKDSSDKYAYIAEGTLKYNNTTGYYTFTIQAVSDNAKRIVLQTTDATADGYTTLVSSDAANVVVGDADVASITDTSSKYYSADPANNTVSYVITIKEELAVSDVLTLKVISTEPTDAESVTYTIDLSGLAPDTFTIVLEDGVGTQTYKNYTVTAAATTGANAMPEQRTVLTDNSEDSIADGLVYFTLDSYFQLPAASNGTVWKLGDTAYNGGARYIVAASDIVSGKITFTADSSSSPVAPVDPIEATSYTVSIVTVDGTAKVLIAAQSGYIPEGTGSVTVYFINPQTGLPDSAQLSYTVENADKASVVYADIENTTSYTIEGGQAVYNGVRSNVTQFAIAAAQE